MKDTKDTSSRKPIPRTAAGRSNGRGLCQCLFTLIGFIVIVFGIAFFNMQRIYTDWYRDFYTFHRGDQVSLRAVGGHMNTLLCRAYDVDLWDMASVHLLPSNAKLSSEPRREHYRDSGLLPDNVYDFQAFYLLPASSLHVRACNDALELWVDRFVPTEIVVVKGRENWQRWLDSKKQADVLQRIRVNAEDVCQEGLHQDLHVIVLEEDHYFVALTRLNDSNLSLPASVGLDLTLHRTVYDVRHARERCLDTQDHCVVNVTFDSDDDIVVEFLGPVQGRLLEDSADFSVLCHERKMFWIGIFVVLPLGLIALLISCSCCCCLILTQSSGSKAAMMRRKKAEVKQAVADGDKATLVDNEHVPPDYSSVTAGSTSAGAISVQVE